MYSSRFRRRKNAKAMWLEESERLAKEKAPAATKVSRLDKEQAHATRCLAGPPFSSESSSTSSDNDGPPDADAYDEDFNAY